MMQLSKPRIKFSKQPQFQEQKQSRNEGDGIIVEKLLRVTYCVVCMVVSEEVVLAFWRLKFEAIDHERCPCNGEFKYQHLRHCHGVSKLERLLRYTSSDVQAPRQHVGNKMHSPGIHLMSSHWEAMLSGQKAFQAS